MNHQTHTTSPLAPRDTAHPLIRDEAHPLIRDEAHPLIRDDEGMATAEYAVGTVGAACVACIILKLADDGTFIDLVRSILNNITFLPDLMPDKFQRLM